MTAMENDGLEDASAGEWQRWRMAASEDANAGKPGKRRDLRFAALQDGGAGG